jgi:hypothetical protein
METSKTAPETRQKLASSISAIGGGYPNPDDPQPPGPWDPVIRTTLERLGPHPEPWRDRLDSRAEIFRTIARRFPAVWDLLGGDRFDSVALNPQPLPPRAMFAVEFARAAVDRLVLIQETADAIANGADQRGIIIVGGRISQLVDDICGTTFPRKFPVPPRPGPEPDPRLSGTELILMGTYFLESSRLVANEQLGTEFAKAGERLVEEGMTRI